MGHAKHRTATEDDEDRARAAAKSERRERRNADVAEKANRARTSRGLRTQGDVGIVESDRGYEQNPLGRRPEPTRFDAMAIAGHQRLPGYEPLVKTRDETTPYPVKPRAPVGPEAMRIQPDEARDLQQSAESAARDTLDVEAEELADEEAFEEHVGESDRPPSRFKHEEDEEERS